jgi:hypothetical protein
MVGFGVAIEKQPPRYRKLKLKTPSVTLDARAEQNPYTEELASMAHSLSTFAGLKHHRITLLKSKPSSGSHAGEPPRAVRPGTRRQNIQIDMKAM